MSGRVLLTASIDHISWLHDPSLGELTMEHDLRVAGQVRGTMTRDVFGCRMWDGAWTMVHNNGARPPKGGTGAGARWCRARVVGWNMVYGARP